ncbi:MAG: ribonuclease HI [Desulfobacterales bacterium]|nr:ribonuclease HI [Desulfobacterales bacterium]
MADRWERMKFKNNKVWVAVDADGRPVIADGRARIRYRREDEEREYRVNPANLRSLDDPAPEPAPPRSRQKAPAGENHIPENAVVIYTDGASSGNPGPSGIGVVLRWGEHEREISRHIGQATNNIAELEAIRAALEAVKNPKLPVRIYTDSSYAYGLLELGWKAKKNTRQVEEIRSLLAAFPDVKILKVKGHAGDPGNERADHLATAAIRRSVGG